MWKCTAKLLIIVAELIFFWLLFGMYCIFSHAVNFSNGKVLTIQTSITEIFSCGGIRFMCHFASLLFISVASKLLSSCPTIYAVSTLSCVAELYPSILSHLLNNNTTCSHISWGIVLLADYITFVILICIIKGLSPQVRLLDSIYASQLTNGVNWGM